jgi:hypothetical protein
VEAGTARPAVALILRSREAAVNAVRHLAQALSPYGCTRSYRDTVSQQRCGCGLNVYFAFRASCGGGLLLPARGGIRWQRCDLRSEAYLATSSAPAPDHRNALLTHLLTPDRAVSRPTMHRTGAATPKAPSRGRRWCHVACCCSSAALLQGFRHAWGARRSAARPQRGLI